MAPALTPSDEDAATLVREGYDVIAEQYARYAAEDAEHPRHLWLQRLLGNLAPQSRVLELGCGAGVPTAAVITAAGHDLVAIDISAGQLERARRNVPSATFVHADVVDVAFEEGAFDAIAALYSLTHVPRHRYPALFARIRHWLAPEGWFLATLGTSDSDGWLEEDFLGFGATNWTNSFDVATTKQLLRDAGLSLETAEVLEHDERWGSERWLYVLARPDDA